MKVSVLIATRNRPQLLGRCVDSLREALGPEDEVIIVDQSDRSVSNGPAPDPETATRIRHEHTDRIGKSNAINHASDLSGGEFLALTDDDVRVPPDWIRTFLELHRRFPDVAAFCGRVLPEDGTRAEDYLNLVLDPRPRRIDRSCNPLNTGFCGANIVIRRDVFRRMGGYDPRFGPGAAYRCIEDGELAYRLAREGLEIRYAPELYVHHEGWRGDEDNRALMRSYAFGLGAFAGHYAKRGDARPLFFLMKKLAYKSIQAVRGLTRGDSAGARDFAAHVSGAGSGCLTALRTD